MVFRMTKGRRKEGEGKTEGLKISWNRRGVSGVVGECKYYFCACFSCYARLTNDPWYERRGDLFLLIPSPNYRTNFSRLSRGLAGAQEYRSPYANRSANKNFTATHLYLCLSCCTLKNYCQRDKPFFRKFVALSSPLTVLQPLARVCD